jgi:hypothetical protein
MCPLGYRRHIRFYHIWREGAAFSPWPEGLGLYVAILMTIATPFLAAAADAKLEDWADGMTPRSRPR